MKTALITLVPLSVAIWFIFINPQLMLSPGPMSKGHTSKTNNCLGCHRPFKNVQDENCYVCHGAKTIGLTKVDGTKLTPQRAALEKFHANIVENKACVDCHQIHEQALATKIESRVWHEGLNISTREQCDICHVKPEGHLHQKIENNCNHCHSIIKWKPADFDHREYFVFDNNHKSECISCHQKENYSKYTCYGCHEHTPSKIKREHLEEGIRNYTDCVKCHRSGNEEEAERKWKSNKNNTWEFEPEKKDSWRKNGNYKKRKHHDDDD